MNISQVASIAKMVFPKWAERIDKAQELAGQFHPSKDGVAQLMQQYGKNRDDLNQAASMLNNPAFQNTLGKIPGLSQLLSQGADALLNDSGVNGQSATPATPAGNAATPPAGGGDAADLFARLKRLG